MSIQTYFTLTFSDPGKTSNITIVGAPAGSGKNNYSTSLDLVGPGYIGYGQSIAQNFVKLLENFSGPNVPPHSIEGQLWYDTSNQNNKVLRINNGSLSSSKWPTASGIYRQDNDPTLDYNKEIKVGDIWVDTFSNQLKIRNDNEWILVGPNVIPYPNKTGTEPVTLESTVGTFHTVIINWINGKEVEIISYEEFTPKIVINGFSTLKPGVNLTNRVSTKFNGLADRASALEVSRGVLIKATDVLKNKISTNSKQIHTGTFVVESNNGLIVKRTASTSELKIYTDSNSAYINFSPTTVVSGNNNFKLGLSDHSYISFKRVNENVDQGKVGINVQPALLSASSSTLTVNGGITLSDRLYINGSSTTTQSLSVVGSATINGNLQISGNIDINGVTTIQNTLYTNNLIPTTSTSVIGSPIKFYDYVYSEHFGSPDNNAAILYGHASYANTLSQTRLFRVRGVVTTQYDQEFNGSQDVELTVTPTNDLIISNEETAETTPTQTLLVLDVGEVGAQLKRIRKQNFLSDIYPSTIQVGMIVPYAGSTPPDGWLLCDGASYAPSGVYVNLYNVIGTTYGEGPGLFKVPNLSNLTPLIISPEVTVNLQYIIKY